MNPEKMKPAPPPKIAQFPPKPPAQLPLLAAEPRAWKNKKPRLPSGAPYWPVAPMPDVAPHGPSRTFPRMGSAARTCAGVGEPLGHFSRAEVTPFTVLPSGAHGPMLSLPEFDPK